MTWIANLSNGETVVEKAPVAGQETSWQQLLKRCRSNDLLVTGLRLYANGITIDAMPTKMCSGYFQAYEALRMAFGGSSKLRQGIGSVVNDSVYITWIDLGQEENNMNYIHQELRPLSEVRIHTTLE